MLLLQVLVGVDMQSSTDHLDLVAYTLLTLYSWIQGHPEYGFNFKVRAEGLSS